MSGTNTNPNLVQSPSTTVIGIGIGTFIVFFLALLNVFVWVLTVACFAGPKVILRITFFLFFVIASSILLFAKKQDKFVDSTTIAIYDSSIIPRVAVCIMMAIFGIYSVILLFGITTEPKKVNYMNCVVYIYVCLTVNFIALYHGH